MNHAHMLIELAIGVITLDDIWKNSTFYQRLFVGPS